MASSYPGGLDSLTNPTGSDSMAVVSHAGQHADANDAIEAIETELGTNPSGASASVKDRLDTLVVGPGSASDNALVRFDGADGKTMQDSGITVDDSDNISGIGTIGSGAITSSGAVQAAAASGFVVGSSGPRVMSGTGSPGGVVTAPVGSQWIDTAATTGAIRWIKASGTGNTGWVVEYGDTGNRNMNATTWLNGWASYGGSGQSLRRIGNVVNMRLELTKASATADDVYTLPSGFRPAISVVHQVWATGAGDDYCVSYVSSSGAVAIVRSLSASNVIYGYVQYITADPWPSSLPGT